MFFISEILHLDLHINDSISISLAEAPLQILVFPLSTLCESPEDVTDVSADAVFAHLSKNGVSSEGLGEPQVVSVCARQPATRLQFNTARQHWPSNFHENKE